MNRLLRTRFPVSLSTVHHQRGFSWTVSKFNQQSDAEQLSSMDYGKLSEKTMQNLFDQLSQLEDAISDASVLKGFDCEYSNGVLTLKLGNSGTFVINKQPPNKQIWLSSPISGPKRYDWDPETKAWIYRRDGSSLFTLLQSELGTIVREKVELRGDD